MPGRGFNQPQWQAVTTNLYVHLQLAHFLACPLLYIHLFCFSFMSVVLLLWLTCAQFFIIIQSRELGNLCRTNVPRRPNLSLLLRRFITDSKLATSCYTHRLIHKSTDSIENKQKEQINLLKPAVCAFMCSTSLTATHKNIKQFVSLWRRGKETHSDLLPHEYMGAKTVQFYTSIWSNSDRPRQKTALKNVDKRCC